MLPNIKHVINAKGGSHQQRGKELRGHPIGSPSKTRRFGRSVFEHQRKGISRFSSMESIPFTLDSNHSGGIRCKVSYRFISEAIVNVDQLHAAGGHILEEGFRIIYATQRSLSSERVNGVPI